MNRVIAFVLGFILFGCSKEQCVYEDYFINNQTDDKPTVYVVSSNNSCNELYLKTRCAFCIGEIKLFI